MGANALVWVLLAMASAIATLCYLKPTLSFSAFEALQWLKGSMAAFPASAASAGPVFGLKISLIVASFYLAQGFWLSTRWLTDRHASPKALPLLRRGHIPLHFLEIPTLLGFVVGGVNLLPRMAIERYLFVLARLAPFLVLFEFAAAWIVLMSLSAFVAGRLTESPTWVKACAAGWCFALVLAALAALLGIYAFMDLSTSAASLLGSLITLAVVEFVACIQVEQASVTEPALLIPYAAYNVLLLAWQASSRVVVYDADDKSGHFVTNTLEWIKSQIRSSSIILKGNFSVQALIVNAVRDALRTVFSPVLIFHILLQLAIMVISARDGEEDDDGQEDGSFFDNATRMTSRLVARRLWPFFGKVFLVLVYTIAWLERSHPDMLADSFSGSIPWYFNASGTWRWTAAFGTLIFYGCFLLRKPSDNLSASCNPLAEYKCDKDFWQQLHRME